MVGGSSGDGGGVGWGGVGWGGGRGGGGMKVVVLVLKKMEIWILNIGFGLLVLNPTHLL